MLSFQKVSSGTIASARPILEVATKPGSFVVPWGVMADDPQPLDMLIKQSAVDGDAVAFRQDAYGTYYRVELEIDGLQQRERLRTLWIIRRGEDVPRLVSAYIV